MNIVSVIRAIAGLSWLLVIGVVAIAILRASRGQRLRGAGTLLLSALAVALILNAVSAGLVFVQAQERGVVVTVGEGGVRPDPLTPGLRWVIPFAENVVFYPISRQTYTMSGLPAEGQIQGDDSVEARTADGQLVTVDASVIFAIDPRKVVDVHIKWQNNYVDNLIRPQARGIIRDEAAQLGVEEVYSSRRDELTQRISDKLQAKLEEGGFILVDFVMRNIRFSPEYAASVEQKQIAEQLALQAAFVVEQRKQEAEQARQLAQGQADAVEIKAKGDANALRIQAQADADARLLRAEAEATALEMLGAAIEENPNVLTLEYVQRLAPNIRVMLLPSDNPLLLPLPDLETLTSPGPITTPQTPSGGETSP